MRRVLTERDVRPGRALELGCGTGVNAVWLAGRGFRVTAVDLSPAAIDRVRRRGSAVRFLSGDLRNWRRLGGPFDFFFDRGCYGAVRLHDVAGYLRSLERVTRRGTAGLVLLGNAAEPEDEAGPPVADADEVRRELGLLFDVVCLRPFRFDAPRPGDHRYLAWSCFVRRP